MIILPLNNEKLSHDNDTGTIEFRCKVTHMFRGCPKPDGWFGCFIKIFGTEYGGDAKLTGVTQSVIPKNATLDVVAIRKDERSYEAVNFEIITKSISGTIAYLASFAGVSRQVAKKITDSLGENAVENIRLDPSILTSAVGLSKKQADAVMNGLSANTLFNKIRSEFPELSAQMVQRVMIQNMTIKDIKDDPYALTHVPGISFPIADAIALRSGWAAASPYRVNHGLVYTLMTSGSGDMFTDIKNDSQLFALMAAVENKLRIQFSSIDEFRARIRIFAGIPNSPIHIDTEHGCKKLYLTSMYDSMMSLADTIKHSLADNTASPFDRNKARNSMRQYESMMQITLTAEQRQAVSNALVSNISIITGGPGRGKTSVIDCIAACWTNFITAGNQPFHGYPDNVLLLAPTGKAVNKLTSATNNKYRTMTIDKLIAYTMHSSGKKSRSRTWIEYANTNSNDQLIIVDESSMIDVEKASNLMTNFPNCRYCFIGDIDQLPPISPGYFLRDMIYSTKIPTSYLTQPLRNGGKILSNADKINMHDTELSWDFTTMPFYPQAADDQTALNAIIDQYNDERQNCPDITQLALLCPMKKGIVGAANLNLTIQNIVCPENAVAQPIMDNRRSVLIYTQKGYPIPGTIYGSEISHTQFRVGDIVMNTKNLNQIETCTYTNNDFWNGQAIDRMMGIFNGDCGRIIGYTPVDGNSHAVIYIQMFDGRVASIDSTAGEFDTFDLGYALTVHKAQGCEYKTVIFVSPHRLESLVPIGFGSKNLIYTAVTRARDRVVVMGSKNALNACIKADLPPRNSDLALKLQ